MFSLKCDGQIAVNNSSSGSSNNSDGKNIVAPELHDDEVDVIKSSMVTVIIRLDALNFFGKQKLGCTRL